MLKTHKDGVQGTRLAALDLMPLDLLCKKLKKIESHNNCSRLIHFLLLSFLCTLWSAGLVTIKKIFNIEYSSFTFPSGNTFTNASSLIPFPLRAHNLLPARSTSVKTILLFLSFKRRIYSPPQKESNNCCK